MREGKHDARFRGDSHLYPKKLLQQYLDLGRPTSRTLADLRFVSQHTINTEFRQIAIIAARSR